jgi:hypothetical protein
VLVTKAFECWVKKKKEEEEEEEVLTWMMRLVDGLGLEEMGVAS